MCVCLTEVHAVLGPAPSFRDPPPAPTVLIGGEGADEVGPHGAKLPPQLEDRLRLLSNHNRACGDVIKKIKINLTGSFIGLFIDSARYLVQVDRQAAQTVDQEEGLSVQTDSC